MKGTIGAYKHSYNLLLKKRLDHSYYFLDYADYNLDHLAMRLKWGPRSVSLYPEGHNRRVGMDYGSDAFIQAKGVFDVLRQSLASIKNIESMVNLNRLDAATKSSLPDSLWSGNQEDISCKDLFKSEAVGYRDLVVTIHKAIRNWENLNDRKGKKAGWPETMEDNVIQRQMIHRDTEIVCEGIQKRGFHSTCWHFHRKIGCRSIIEWKYKCRLCGI